MSNNHNLTMQAASPILLFDLSMESVFPIVLFGAIALFVAVGVLSMLSRNNLYDQIGQGGMFLNEDQEHAALRDGGRSKPLGLGEFESPAGRSSIGRAEREQEIRQMLHARSDRLVRQGHAPLDIDAELAKLETAPPSAPVGELGSRDPVLAEEVRQLVVARNERRKRQGQSPLDVDAEVQRTLAEFDA